jgi:hypothetical protein
VAHELGWGAARIERETAAVRAAYPPWALAAPPRS